MKVFADHAQMVEEKAAHVGMSIRASGHAEAGRTREGLPILKELTSAESVDVVTRAGAGGMILTEAARGAQTQQEVSEVDATELKALQESLKLQEQTNKRLLERAIKGDAREEATRLLESVSLPAASKSRVISDVLAREIPVKDGELDRTVFGESVNSAAKAEGAYVASLTGGGRVQGMGASVITETADQIAMREARAKADDERSFNVFESLMGNSDAAKLAAKGRNA
jgi:hypothetical protein